jgi:S1-C subfamily serine protease
VRRALVLALMLGLLAACVEPPPTSPPVASPTPARAGIEKERARIERTVREYTVRIRNVNCLGGSLGTGWALDRRTIVTNRHVVEGAQRVEIETWAGESLAVASVELAAIPDLALLHLAHDFDVTPPELAKKNPKVGTRVHIVGYPEGRAPKGTQGVVTKYTKKFFTEAGGVAQMSGNIFQGNSGSPVVDRLGRVVGVAVILEFRNGWGGMVPVSQLHQFLDGGPRTALVPAC